MRILMVSEDLPAQTMGGLAKHVLTLSKTLIQQGHQVDLMGNNDADWPLDLPASLYFSQFYGELKGQYRGWKEMQLGVFNPIKRTFTARRFAHAIKLKAQLYDVIHYHGHLPNIAKFIPSQINFIQTRHDQGSECLTHVRFKNGLICNTLSANTCASCRTARPNWLQQKISALAVKRFRSEVQQGFRKHKTVFVSDFLQSKIQHCFGSGNWGLTLHNFIDEVDLHQAQSHAINAPVSENKKIIKIFVAAKLYAAKGVAEFLAAISKQNSDDFKIDIAGDGELEQQLRQRHQSATIQFHGWQSASTTLALVIQADVMVVPSLCEEACATTVLEGLALGKTVFALALGGTTELVIYEKYPQQLKLFPTMSHLATSLAQFQAPSSLAIAPYRYPDVRYAAQSLIKLYQLPPGSIAE
jgi:glycosyltransferase involved in cell wall biosynthesis